MEKNALRIVIVISYSYPFIGSGIGNVASNQAESLVKEGHEVTIISSNFPHTKSDFVYKNIRFIKLAALNFLYKIHVPVPLFFFNRQSIELIKKADVVHVHDILYPSSLLAVLYAMWYKKPVVLTQHIPFVHYKNPLLNIIQQIVFLSSGFIILRYAKKIIYFNSEVKQYLSSYKHKLLYIPNGVDHTMFHPVTTSEKNRLRKLHNLPVTIPIVIFVGRLVPKKGYRYLCQAASDRYFIVLVGEGNLDTQYEHSHIRHIGPVNQQELSKLYQLSDVFILPSHSEGYPLSVQEAMATGLPIIVSDLQCYRDIELDRHLVSFIKPSAETIKKSILEIIDNHSLAQKMAEYSKKTAARNSTWNSHISQLISVYREVL